MSDQVYDDPQDPGLRNQDEPGLVPPGVDPGDSATGQSETSHEADIEAGYDDDDASKDAAG